MSSEDIIMTVVDKPERKLVKVWSEARQKYNYKYRTPEYYREYFHKNKKDMKCEHCGKTVSCQMYSHLKSKKCLAIRTAAELKQTKEEIAKLYQAISSV